MICLNWVEMHVFVSQYIPLPVDPVSTHPHGDRSFMTHLGCIEDFRGVDILTDLPLYGYGRVKEIDSVSTIAHYHQHVHVAGYYNIGGFWNGELSCKLAEMKAKATRKITISLVPQQDATNSYDGGLLDVLKYVLFIKF